MSVRGRLVLPRPSVARASWPWLAAGAAVAVVAAGLVAARLVPGGPVHWIMASAAAIRDSGPAGAAGFAAIAIAIAFSGVLPASLVGLAAGAVYGVPVGFAISGVGTMGGAWLAFRASRSLLRARIERMLANRPRLSSLDLALAGERWRLVCLLRVSPVMPFALASYALGLSSVSERDYLLGTLAALPALLGYVCLGALAHAGLSAGAHGAGAIRWAVLALGIAATALLTVKMGRVLARIGLAPAPEAAGAGARK